LTRVRFDQVVSETLSLLEERLASAGVELDWQPPAEPLMVQGNEGELHQVITNLVVNAIDAMSQQSEGERRLTLRLESLRPAANGLADATLPVLGERATLTIADTGPGIPPERLDTIFKPFFSSKLGRGGSGLGLAISFNIVRRHAGTLTVRNQPAGQRGCTFSVELPRSVQVH
jgi:signal transduction histidine kinase